MKIVYLILVIFVAGISCQTADDGTNCDSMTDIVFMIDASESMKVHQFVKEKEFAADVADKLSPKSRVGAIVFSSSLEIMNLRDWVDIATFVTRVKAMTFLNEGTRTHEALEAFLKMVEEQGRPDARSIGIVITDGASRNKTKTKLVSDLIRSKGYHLGAVGIGNEIDSQELTDIAGSADLVLTATDFDNLATLVKNISSKVCPTPAPTTQAPTTQAPTTQAPTTQAPTTQAPTTKAPTTVLPPNAPEDTTIDPPNPDSLCSECQFINGVAYLPHPRLCNMYYQCQENIRGAHLMHCSEGLFWSQEYLTCQRPANVECARDPCKDESITMYAATGKCGSYWMCRNNRTHSLMCCDPAEEYKTGVGCVTSTTCFGGCSPLNPPPAPVGIPPPIGSTTCDKSAHTDETKFYQTVNGKQTEMMCAPGTGYVHSDCGCTKHVRIPQHLISTGCQPELYLPFDKNTKDYSGKSIYGQKEGTITITSGVPGTVGDGAALFDGNSRLIFWYFSNNDFQKTLLIKFRYLEMPTSQEGKNETLVANSNCDIDWSVAVNVDRQVGKTVGHLKTKKKELIHTVQNSGEWKEVELRYYQGEYTLNVNGQLQSTHTTGNIAMSPAALQIGGECTDTHGFTGYIDEFYLYKCV